MTSQTLKLRLSPDGQILTVARLNRNGIAGTKTLWRIRGTSLLPQSVFFIIQTFVRQGIKNCGEKNDYPPARKAVLRALGEAGAACGCKVRIGQDGADVLWVLKGTPLLAIQLHEQNVKMGRLNELLLSEAILRWTLAIRKGGYFRIEPRKTNLDN
jgi:hypothetical protein